MGYYLTVTEVCARYYHPAVYDEMVTVYTWVEEVRSRAVTLSYDVRDEQDRRLVMACTRHVCITHDGKPARLPDALYDVLKAQIEA
jgi:acyl-CoA thioester hydrolase